LIRQLTVRVKVAVNIVWRDIFKHKEVVVALFIITALIIDLAKTEVSGEPTRIHLNALLVVEGRAVEIALGFHGKRNTNVGGRVGPMHANDLLITGRGFRWRGLFTVLIREHPSNLDDNVIGLQ